MSEKKPRWRIELTQLRAEDIPSRWRRFWGDKGDPRAWHAAFWDQLDGSGNYEFAFGYTREEALELVKARIAKVEAKEKLAEQSKEVIYV